MDNLPALRAPERSAPPVAGPPPVLAGLVRPGDWALQVGPGPVAAQMVRWTGHTVVSLQSTTAEVEDVRAALGPAGRNAGLVDVEAGDLYDGRPGAGPYDVIVVTTAVTGLSPRWIDQLKPGGVIIAPVALGGLHPWIVAGRDPRDGLLCGRVIGCDLPAAAPPRAGGILYSQPPALPGARPAPELRRTGPLPRRMTVDQYPALWMFAAVSDDMITAVVPDGMPTWGPTCALTTGDSAVYLRPDGIWPSDANPATDTLTHCLAELSLEWGGRFRPEVTDWTCRFVQHPDEDPVSLATPTGWSMARPAILPR
ncbi:hypothetical protein AB0D22_35455 [Kitasatospora sp. NPDC048538]|uniref:hypothetical protein n=1 Tax=Kitasatospora sp. NPDC048538 TaxID=3155633 RepID=UPI0033E0F04E